MLSLLNKKAIVTGASKGLGLGIANKLAQSGCSVTLVARNEKLLEQNLSGLAKVDSSQNHNYIPYDLGNLLTSTNSDLVSELTNLSILVNCAGITTHALLSRISEQDVVSTINLNLTVPILLSRLACKPMMKLSAKVSSSPVIINVASVLSLTNTSVPGTSVYAALKSGILGFSQALASEFRGRIRVNSILPGLIKETEMGKGANVEADELHLVSLEKVLEETMRIISDNKTNGQNLIIDGRGVRPLETIA